MRKAIIACLFLLLSSFQGTLSAQMIINYQPLSASVGGSTGNGKWQLMVITPDGKRYRDKKNGLIDFQNPPAKTLRFKVPGRVHFNKNYTILLYVAERADSIPADIVLMAGTVNVTFEKKSLAGITIYPGFFWGNTASTTTGDTSEVVVNAFRRFN